MADTPLMPLRPPPAQTPPPRPPPAGTPPPRPPPAQTPRQPGSAGCEFEPEPESSPAFLLSPGAMASAEAPLGLLPADKAPLDSPTVVSGRSVFSTSSPQEEMKTRAYTAAGRIVAIEKYLGQEGFSAAAHAEAYRQLRAVELEQQTRRSGAWSVSPGGFQLPDGGDPSAMSPGGRQAANTEKESFDELRGKVRPVLEANVFEMLVRERSNWFCADC